MSRPTARCGVAVANGDHQRIPLSEWLRQMRTKAARNSIAPSNTSSSQQAVAEDDTLKEWLQTTAKQEVQPPTAEEQERQKQRRDEEVKERLRVAIAVATLLSDIHEGRNKGEEARYDCNEMSLEDISLDTSDSYCLAKVHAVGDGDAKFDPSDRRKKEMDMNHLGRLLNAIFGGEGGSSEDLDEEADAGEDPPTKKRGKGQPVAEDLPLYLTCLLSSLISSGTPDPRRGAADQYGSVKQVLQDLRTAATKSEVYLKSSTWDDAKSNRLPIPRGCFYGRESELSLVLHSLDTVLRFGQPVMVAVSGYAGMGKTALLNQVEKPLREAGGFVVRAKFGKSTSSTAVIFSALDSFFGQINNNGNADLKAELKDNITASVGCGLGILMSAVPNLWTLIEENGSVSDNKYDVEETAVSHQRWKFLVIKLIQCISSESRPLAFFMDDLHWCNDVTMDMIQMIVMNPDIRYCLYLGSYRINAQEAAVTKALEYAQSQGVRLVSLKVSCIEREAVNSLVSEALSIPPSLCQSLATTVHSKTGGFILFAIDLLKSLHEEGLLRFNLSTRGWEYNTNDIRQRKIPQDVVQHLSHRMTRLPNNIQSLLKIAACLGFEFDAELLEMASKGNKSPMLELLSTAIASGFLQQIPQSKKIVFAHDQIHLAAYQLIPSNKRESSHLLIGSRIYMKTTTDELLDKVIFDIVNNMNVGLHLISSQEQKNEVAQLNLTAGRKAMAQSSYAPAAEYFMHGIGLLSEDCWRRNYATTLVLHQAASEALFVASDYESLNKVVEEQLTHANSLDDKLQAYHCLVRYRFATSQVKEAMEKTRSILSELGESFPEATPELIYDQLVSTKALLSNLTKQDILKDPTLASTDERKLWTMRFLDCLMKYLFSTRPSMLPLVACRMIRISEEFGFSSFSAMGFAAYALAQLNVLQDIDEAYKWAKLTLCIPENFGASSLLPKYTCLFHSFSSFLKEPLQASCEVFIKAHEDLLLVGDVEYAVIAIFNHCRQGLFAGKDLLTVEKECAAATLKMTRLKQIQQCLSHSSHHQIILKLTGDAVSKNPFDIFSGVFDEIKDEDDLLQHAVSTGKTGVIQAIHFNRLFLAYWFKRFDEAAEYAGKYKCRTMMPLIDIYHSFYHGLTALQLMRCSTGEEKENEWRGIAKASLSSFQTWASHSAWNWENKYMLLEAERHFSECNMNMAEEKYEAAIESSQRHRFVNEEGLSHELFSAFHAANGNDDKAESHLLAARDCYQKWGAFAVIEHLNKA